MTEWYERAGLTTVLFAVFASEDEDLARRIEASMGAPVNCVGRAPRVCSVHAWDGKWVVRSESEEGGLDGGPGVLYAAYEDYENAVWFLHDVHRMFDRNQARTAPCTCWYSEPGCPGEPAPGR